MHKVSKLHPLCRHCRHGLFGEAQLAERTLQLPVHRPPRRHDTNSCGIMPPPPPLRRESVQSPQEVPLIERLVCISSCVSWLRHRLCLLLANPRSDVFTASSATAWAECQQEVPPTDQTGPSLDRKSLPQTRLVPVLIGSPSHQLDLFSLNTKSLPFSPLAAGFPRSF